TVGDVIDAISAASGVNVTATVNSTQSGLTIVDDNAAPVRNLSIADSGGTTTTRDLGICVDPPGPIVRPPLNPRLTPTTSLNLLYGGRGVHLETIHITNGTQETDIDLSTAHTMGDVLNAINTSTAGGTGRIQHERHSVASTLDKRQYCGRGHRGREWSERCRLRFRRIRYTQYVEPVARGAAEK